MSLYDDVYYALDMGYGSYGAQQDVKKLLEEAAKDAEEKGLVITGYQTLEYKKDDDRGSTTQTYQIPVYNTAEQALVDKLFQEKIASGEYVKAEDVDKVPEAKIYEGDYVSKFAEGGEGYINPYLNEQEALKNIPKDFPGQDVLQGFADLKSTPIPELQINPAVSAPVTEALPVNTTYNNSAAIANIVGGLSSVTAPISVKGLGTISGSGAVTPPSTDTKAVTPAPTNARAVTPAPRLQPGIPGLTSARVMRAPAVQPPATQPPAVQPPPTTPTGTGSQGDGLTQQQKQFMQTVQSLQESERQRAAAERVTRQNMARAGQTADIRLGIQNGQTASGVDAFKRRFKIGQQSPSTNLMINA